ncbi:Rhomboid-family protein [Sphingomonas paucimobilis]|nr:Rhomboid-family protein [Sphingomonas paucimobilis]
MTNSIAAITFAAFVILLLTGQIDNAALLGGFIPARIADPGLFDGVLAVPGWLTPLSCTLIHAGWLHLGFNLLMLVFCGRQVEQVLHKGAFLILYVAGAYAACALQWAIQPASANPMVGASGAISAVIATYSLLYSQQPIRRMGPFSANVLRVLWLAAGWIVIQLMIGVATAGGMGDLGQIAVAAHIGGFLAGLLLTRPLLWWRFRKGPRSLV